MFSGSGGSTPASSQGSDRTVPAAKRPRPCPPPQPGTTIDLTADASPHRAGRPPGAQAVTIDLEAGVNGAAPIAPGVEVLTSDGELNAGQRAAHACALGGGNVFLTGSAGTGKSYLLKVRPRQSQHKAQPPQHGHRTHVPPGERPPFPYCLKAGRLPRPILA
jgi:hypothetical protein